MTPEEGMAFVDPTLQRTEMAVAPLRSRATGRAVS